MEIPQSADTGPPGIVAGRHALLFASMASRDAGYEGQNPSERRQPGQSPAQCEEYDEDDERV